MMRTNRLTAWALGLALMCASGCYDSHLGGDGGTPPPDSIVGSMPSCARPATRFEERPIHWVDISGTGRRLANVSRSDDNSERAGIGFRFPLLGDSYRDAHVSSNGFLALSTASSADRYENDRIPNPRAPNALVAPLWDDLDPGTRGDVYVEQLGRAPARAFVTQWQSVAFIDGTTPSVSFQTILWENGSIEFQYETIGTSARARGGQATIGIEDGSGRAGIQHSFNSTSLRSNLNLTLCRPAP